MTEIADRVPWSALIGALVGTFISGITLAFYFGGEMRQTLVVAAEVRRHDTQLKAGRDALIAQNTRVGVLESKVETLQREVETLRKRMEDR